MNRNHRHRHLDWEGESLTRGASTSSWNTTKSTLLLRGFIIILNMKYLISNPLLAKIEKNILLSFIHALPILPYVLYSVGSTFKQE